MLVGLPVMNALAPTARKTMATTKPVEEKPEEVPAPPKLKREMTNNPWNVHVTEYRKAHPGMSFKQALKEAKETYTKVAKPEKRKREEEPVGPEVESE